MQRAASLPPHSLDEDNQVSGGSIPAVVLGDPQRALLGGLSQRLSSWGAWRWKSLVAAQPQVALGTVGCPLGRHSEAGHPLGCKTFSNEVHVSFTGFGEVNEFGGGNNLQ